MPIAKRWFVQAAVLICIFCLLGLWIVPIEKKILVLLGAYFILLLDGLGYYHYYKMVLQTIRMYDQEEQFAREIEYLDEVKKRGYQGFVYDSYRIYALYMLGHFDAYEKTAQRLASTKRWQSPKMKDFRDKIMDNLCCIAFLKGWAKDGQIHYEGSNVLMIQAIADYRLDNKAAIVSCLETYEDLPKLKKACLQALSGQFDKIDNLYQSGEPKEIFEKIKGRERHG